MLANNGKGVFFYENCIVRINFGYIADVEFEGEVIKLRYSSYDNTLCYIKPTKIISGEIPDHLYENDNPELIIVGSSWITAKINKLFKHKLPYNYYKDNQQYILSLIRNKCIPIKYSFDSTVLFILLNNIIYCPFSIDIDKLYYIYKENYCPGRKQMKAGFHAYNTKKFRKWVLKNYKKAIISMKHRKEEEIAKRKEWENEMYDWEY